MLSHLTLPTTEQNLGTNLLYPVNLVLYAFYHHFDTITVQETLISPGAGMGHGVGTHCGGVGGDVSVGARSCWLAAANWTESGGTLGKVNNLLV